MRKQNVLHLRSNNKSTLLLESAEWKIFLERLPFRLTFSLSETKNEWQENIKKDLLKFHGTIPLFFHS